MPPSLPKPTCRQPWPSADVARDGADVVLLNDDLNVLPVMMEQARHPSNHPSKPDLGERIQSGCRSIGRIWLRYPVDCRARHEFQLAAGVGQCLEIVETKGRLKRQIHYSNERIRHA